jgi:Pyruvate/2-oxoacid:ferredoxin oxidoreductase gamma subunit
MFVRHGLYAFINQDFASRIRDGHNFDQVRISDAPMHAVAEKVPNGFIKLKKIRNTTQKTGCMPFKKHRRGA